MPRGMIVLVRWSLLLLGTALLVYIVWYAASGDMLPPVSNYVTIPPGLEGDLVYSPRLILTVVLVLGLVLGLSLSLALGLVLGLADGLIYGLAAGLTAGLVVALEYGPVVGLAIALVVGLAMGLSFILCYGLGMLPMMETRRMAVNWFCAR